MKELRGSASVTVAAPLPQCVALLEAVDSYPGWYPEVVRGVEVVERGPGGRPARIRTTLHLARGPLERDFDLLMAVTAEPPGTVRLSRVRHGPSDEERFEVSWQVEDEGQTRIQLQLDASLSVPRLVPLGGIGDAVAEGFVAAAARALG